MIRCLFQSRILIYFVVFGLSLSMGLAAAADVPKRIGPDQPRLNHASRPDIGEINVVLPAGAVLVPLDSGVPSGIALWDPQAKVSATLLSEGFEGSWPVAPWQVFHNSGAPDMDWGKNSYRKFSGSYSIWPGATGSQAPGVGNNLPSSTYSWAVAGPFDFSAASSGQLEYDMWLDAENQEDFFWYLASTDGQSFSGPGWTGTTDWSHINADLTDFGQAGNLTGQPQVWFAFIYESDETINSEGVYIDNVVINVDSGGGSNCGTYVIDNDNDNNSYSGTADGDWHECLFNTDARHPIEFHIDINETSAQTAQLLLLCNDVDEEGSSSTPPEVDNVYINNTFIGTLIGADGEDSTTVLNVPTNSLIIGRNTVRIDVNQGQGTDPDDWCVELKQAQLIIDGGCEGQAACRYVTTDHQSYDPGDNVTVTYEIDTNIQGGPQQIRVESNIVGPNGNIVSGTERNYTVTGTANEPQDVILNLPGTADSGTYRVEIWVFDSLSGRLDTSCSTTFTVAGGSNCTLTCTASVPATGQVGVPVNFNSSSTATGCTGQPEYFWFPDTSTTAMAPGQNIQLTYDQPGTYNWELSVVQDNQTCQRSGSITISAAANCTVTCAASVPTTGTVGVPITFSGSATATNCNSQPSYFWYPDLNTTAMAPGQTVQITYDQPGTYNWGLDVVVDNQTCRKTGSITISAAGGCTLSCSASAPATATVGQAVNFTGNAYPNNCNGTPAFFWDFGDFTPASGQQNPTHTFTAAGTYQWQMTTWVGGVNCLKFGTITVSPGGSNPCTYSYWIPVASRATGVNNSQWRTDLGLLSLSNSTANVEVRFYGPNGLRTRTTTVGPRNQLIITDVINWVAPGTSGSGAIEVCSDQPLYISSRTYNQLPANDPCFPNGTFGQYIGSLGASAGIGVGQPAWLPQLVENWAYRTNIGLMNMGTANANVRVTLYNGSGQFLATYTENLTAGEWSQKSRPFYNNAGLTNMAAGSAYIEVLSGSGVIAYASLIDNFTNDATTIWMVR